MISSEQQPQLWQHNSHSSVFADLCNALYERELRRLALDSQLSLLQLKQRISSLSYYIRRASERMIAVKTPMTLDSRNASWMFKQLLNCPAQKQTDLMIEQYYLKQVKVALIVPIYTEQAGEQQIRLDSIDDYRQQQIHTNEHGWFDMNSQPLDEENQAYRLLKPLKGIMIAACSGHRWINRKRTSAGTLSLREILLATHINWTNLSKPHTAQII